MKPPIIIYDGPDVCAQCLGWKHVANSEDGESWKHWAELPAPSNIAVSLGVVYPVECPRCKGSGKEPSAPGGSEEVAAAGADLETVRRLTVERNDLRRALDVALAELEATRPYVFSLAKTIGRCDMAFEIILKCTSAAQAHRTARRMRIELAPVDTRKVRAE